MNREELIALKKKLGLPDSWHEPDQQDVTAKVIGGLSEEEKKRLERLRIQFGDLATPYKPDGTFDNAGCERELKVELYQNEKKVAVVNLAMLFAWATGYKGRAYDGKFTEEEE